MYSLAEGLRASPLAMARSSCSGIEVLDVDQGFSVMAVLPRDPGHNDIYDAALHHRLEGPPSNPPPHTRLARRQGLPKTPVHRRNDRQPRPAPPFCIQQDIPMKAFFTARAGHGAPDEVCLNFHTSTGERTSQHTLLLSGRTVSHFGDFFRCDPVESLRHLNTSRRRVIPRLCSGPCWSNVL